MVPPVNRDVKEGVAVLVAMVKEVLRVHKVQKEKWDQWVPWVYREKKVIVAYLVKEEKKANKVLKVILVKTALLVCPVYQVNW